MVAKKQHRFVCAAPDDLPAMETLIGRQGQQHGRCAKTLGSAAKAMGSAAKAMGSAAKAMGRNAKRQGRAARRKISGRIAGDASVIRFTTRKRLPADAPPPTALANTTACLVAAEANPCSFPQRRSGSARRTHAQRGAFNVEMALVFIPLFAIFMGIIDVSFALFKRSLLQGAVREGVRYAVTYQTSGNTNNNHDLSIKKVVQKQCIGFLTDAQRDNLVVIRYYEPFTNASGNPDWRLATGTGSNRPGNLVEVGIENYEHRYIVPIWHMLAPGKPYTQNGWQAPQPMRVSVYAADRMEGLPAGVMSPPTR